MHEKYDSLQNNNRQQEIKLYELLSKLIHQFCQLVHAVQRMLIVVHEAPSMIQIQSVASFQQKLKGSLFNQNGNKRVKLKTQQDLSPSFNTFRRCSCRLIQILLPFKQQIQTSEYLYPMKNLISNLQNTIYLLQQNKNVHTFIAQTYSYFYSFVTQIRKKINSGSKIFPVNKKTDVSEAPDKTYATTRDIRSKTFQIQPQYQKKMRKLLAEINLRFKTMDCMDLDYSYFRASYFQNKNTNQFYEQYIQRNQNINNQIKKYERDYNCYLRKKQKRRSPKNFDFLNTKISLGKTLNNNDQSICLQKRHPYESKKVSFKVNNWANADQTQQYRSKKYSLGQDSQFFSSLPKQKIKYQMKKVIIAAYDLKTQESIQVQRPTLKNTLRQLQASKRKYCKFQQRPFLKNMRQLSKPENIQK